MSPAKNSIIISFSFSSPRAIFGLNFCISG